MKKLTNFNEFMFNKLMEEIDVKVNELELILSPRLKNILKEIDHQIAEDLLELHMDSKREYKKTFVDLGSDSDKVSFIQANKVPELIEPDLVHGHFTRNPNFKLPPNWAKDPDERAEDEKSLGEYEFIDDEWKNPWIQDVNHILDLHEIQFSDKNHPVWHKYRAETKVGRFISQMFPNKYPANVKASERVGKPKDVESFVNMFIATVESKAKKIEPVKGEDIRKFYNCENYYKIQGSLGGSCMRDPEKGDQLGIYVDNPEKVSMLVLFPEEIRDKIIGRAILWKIDRINGKDVEKDTYLMDRVYTAEGDKDEQMFKEYAKKKGYYMKQRQTYEDWTTFVTPDGEVETLFFEVDLKPLDYGNKYTYMDTMIYYNPKTGVLTNSDEGYRDGNFAMLRDYMGSAAWY